MYNKYGAYVCDEKLSYSYLTNIPFTNVFEDFSVSGNPDHMDHTHR